jgi:Bacterial Ig-like domain (group 2)/FG-GAP-like repeat
MLNSIKCLFMCGIIAGLFAGCGSSEKSNDVPSDVRHMAVVTAVQYKAPASVCANGGITVESGIDTNGNSVLDPSEVTSTQYVCNGANGADGMVALLSLVTELSGTNCTYGGTRVNGGLDTNKDGLLEDAEVTSTSYVCNGSPVPTGNNGHDSLLSIVTEPSGTNCVNGGLKVCSGPDVDDSGVLDPGEITSTSYVCSASTSTVPTLTSISVVPASPSIPAGATQQFAAIGRYSDGTTYDLTPYVAWSSSNTVVASASGSIFTSSNGLFRASGIGTATITATFAGYQIISGSAFMTVTPTALRSISISPSSTSLITGASVQFSATGTYSDGTIQILTSSATWTSSSASIATVSNSPSSNGVATGVAAGTTTISASMDGYTGMATLTVKTLTLLTLSPVNVAIEKGATNQFTATGKFSDNTTQNLTSQVTWTTGDATKATITSSGLATGVAIGSTSVSASLANVSASTTISVKSGFLAGVHYTSSSLFVGNTAVGDLNGDGRNDVVAIQSDAVLIYYQNSGGTLDPAVVLTTGLVVNGVEVKDVNNDGLADLIISGNSKTATSGFLGRVVVYRQNALSHSLDSPQEYTLSTGSTGPLAIADLNNDSRPDIVSAGTDAAGNGVVSMLFQQPDGSLGAEITYTGVPVVVDGEVHVADMNNDGLNDIVLQSGDKQLAVVKQVSPGAFSATPEYYQVQTSYWPYFRSFALGDLNGDGLTDVAVGDPGNSPNLNIFYQNTSGTLTGPTIKSNLINTVDEVDIADIDGDGLNDLILITDGNWIEIVYQANDHTFLAPMTYHLPTSSSGGTSIHQAMSVADINNDGLLDIVASWSNEGIYILPQKP